jgi:hypothetical protein
VSAIVQAAGACLHFLEFQSVPSLVATHTHQLHCSVASAAGLAATSSGIAASNNNTINDGVRSPESACVVADDEITRLMIKTCR